MVHNIIEKILIGFFAKTCKGKDVHKKVMIENFRYL